MASLTVPRRSNSWNSFRSAPAMKPAALAERITTPLGGSIARRSTMSPSSSSTSCDIALTGLSRGRGEHDDAVVADLGLPVAEAEPIEA
jgi:hypothetical protein